MKSIVFTALLLAASACAQTTPIPPAPGAPAPAQPQLPPETVIATYGQGSKVTLGELMKYINAMPPQMQQKAMQNRKEFVEQFVLMHHLAEMAEKAKLDEVSPTKDSLAFNRLYLLMNAELHEEMSHIVVPVEEAKAYYDKNNDRFIQAKVKTLYVSFASNSEPATDGKKHLTEAEAQAKIAKLRAEIVGGADFVKLVKENSDDQASAAKDGDFGYIRRTDKLPEAIHKAVFALKAGDVTEPIKQPNGFYLFRAEEIGTQPFVEVQNQIVNDLKTTRFNAWMEQTKDGLKVKLEEPVVTPSAPPAATTAPQPAPAKP